MKFKINITKKRLLKEAVSTMARGLYDEDPLGLVNDPFPDIKASTEPTPGIEYPLPDDIRGTSTPITATTTTTTTPTTTPTAAVAPVTTPVPATDVDHTDHDHTEGLVNINQIEGLNIKNNNRQYGTVAMRDYLSSLGNVAGGNYYVEDISSEHGGHLGGHLSHQSGIDADISIPTTGDGHSISQRQNGRWRFKSALNSIDYNRTLAFLRHSAPHAKRILLDRRYHTELKRLAQEEISAGRMNQEEYDRLFVGGRRIVQHYRGHANHFHVRLNTPGLNDPHSTGRRRS